MSKSSKNKRGHRKKVSFGYGKHAKGGGESTGKKIDQRNVNYVGQDYED